MRTSIRPRNLLLRLQARGLAARVREQRRRKRHDFRWERAVTVNVGICIEVGVDANVVADVVAVEGMLVRVGRYEGDEGLFEDRTVRGAHFSIGVFSRLGSLGSLLVVRCGSFDAKTGRSLLCSVQLL